MSKKKRRTYTVELDVTGPYEVFPRFDNYVADGTLSIELVTANDFEECLCEVTTCIPGAFQGLDLDRSAYILVKDYSENSGMVRELVKNDIIEPTIIGNFKTGFVEVGMYKLSTDFRSHYGELIDRALNKRRGLS